MKRWYIVTTYSGYENSVKTDLERRRISMNMENMIYQVLIPEETVEVVDKKGKKKEKVNKLFPGYVFVEMEIDEVKGMDDDVWFMVRNTPKVTGFLGSSGGGTKPVPVANDEMNQILSKLGLVVKPKLDFAVGDKIEVISGAFAGKITEITEINEDKGIVTVLFELFGSYTPTELNVDQIKKI
ncbi:MAG: transcription termination/antitermination factor NusG [Acholeplasmatales bacterium]|jgi:transcriptional antiterminator NusG|nr:transcription termination/antitermination factor NusG [Acholeplasmatales bacterium]